MMFEAQTNFSLCHVHLGLQGFERYIAITSKVA